MYSGSSKIQRAGAEAWYDVLWDRPEQGGMNMNLVNELQVSAEKDDVLTVLRKTKRLASKLGRQDINDWLRSELEGYTDSATVPDYRQVRATIAMNTNGHIPAGFGYLANGI